MTTAADDSALLSTYEWISTWVSEHQSIVGILIFFIAMSESLVVIGIIVPGAALMVSAGVLISDGKLSFWAVTLWAIAGAIAGDGISYWLGYHYKDRLRTIWPFSRSKALLARGEEFFKRHGGKSIVFGRFVGPVRAIIPTIAGMMDMKPKDFTVVNVISAIAWAPLYLLPGIVFGKLILDIGLEIGVRIIVLFVVVAVLLLIVHWMVRHTYSYLAARTHDFTVKLLTWCTKRPRLGQYMASLFEPDTPAYKTLVASASVLFFTVLLFIVAIGFALGPPQEGGFATTFNHFLQTLRDPVGDKIMVFFTMLADNAVLLPILATVVIWFAIKRHYSAVLHLLFTVVSTAIMIRLFKYIIGAPRPSLPLIDQASHSYSFPSGHTTIAMAVYGFITVLVANGIGKRWRSIPYITAALIVTMIGLSRMYLGEHWLTDVVGGILLGLIWLSLTGLSYQRHLHKTYSSRSLIASVLLVGLIAVVVNYQWDFDRQYNLARKNIVHPQVTLNDQAWWQDEWRTLPVYRVDLRKIKNHPLNLQFAGDLELLKLSLLANGWSQPIKFSALNTVRWMHTKPKLEQIPTIPHVHNTRHESVLLVKQDPQKKVQFVIRLWRADVTLKPSNARLYIGNVSQQKLQKTLYLFNYLVTGDDFRTPLQVLRPDLAGFTVKQETRRKVRPLQQTQWSGRILLIK